MNTKSNRIILSISTLFVATGLALPAVAADKPMPRTRDEAVAMSAASEIPTTLTNEPRGDQLDGTCSRCSVDDLSVVHEDTSTAVLDLYFEDDGEDKLADIQVRTLLQDGTYRYLVIPSVELLHQQNLILELPADLDWEWDEVRHAWIEVD
ncbi:MAG: hypothetical protein AAGF11_21480 [Myxococcota bacterium]